MLQRGCFFYNSRGGQTGALPVNSQTSQSVILDFDASKSSNIYQGNKVLPLALTIFYFIKY